MFNRSGRRIVLLALVGCLGITAWPQSTVQFRQQSAAQMLKEGTYYQSIDDTTDRAADWYRQLLQKFPSSPQAEPAQFYLGTYYQKKFFILESRSKVQDWTSFNQAEAALNTYISQSRTGKGGRNYLSDAYFNLALIALRRGYPDQAKQLLAQMKASAAMDRVVYIHQVVWTPRTDDLIKANCDAASLATASSDRIGSDRSFDRVVARIRDWCRQNCKTGA